MINQGKISYSSSKSNDVVNDFVKGVGSLTYDTSLIKIGEVHLWYDEYNERTITKIYFTPVVFTEKALRVLIHTVALLNVQLRNYWQVKVYADLDYALKELNRRERSRHSYDTPLEDEWSYDELTTPEEQEIGVTYLDTWLSYEKDEGSLMFPDGKLIVYGNKRINDTRYKIDTLECVVDYLIDKEYKHLYNNV